VKPNLFIVGAGKAGTSALYYYLGQHPDVYMSRMKEPNYFGADLQFRRWRTTEEQYLFLFRDAGGRKYRGEASVSYLLSATAASEIRAYSPDAKIIIIVRNPFEVLQARHVQNLMVGHETVARFERALDLEAERRRGRRVPKEAPVVDYLYYREWVNYSEQINRYLQCFPREQVFIGVYDDLKRDAAAFYRSVLEFLELPPHSPEFAQVNVRTAAKSYLLQRLLIRKDSMTTKFFRVLMPSRMVRKLVHGALLKANVAPDNKKEIAPALRTRLGRELEGEVRTLGALLGRDLSHWLEAK